MLFRFLLLLLGGLAMKHSTDHAGREKPMQTRSACISAPAFANSTMDFTRGTPSHRERESRTPDQALSFAAIVATWRPWNRAWANSFSDG